LEEREKRYMVIRKIVKTESSALIIFFEPSLLPFAERELLKFFQQHGIVAIVITEDDLIRVMDGSNLITLVRTKYEEVRLDLKKKSVILTAN